MIYETATAVLSAGLVVALFIVLLVVLLGKHRGLGAVLVLREFTVKGDGGPESIISIRGRPSGILGWILTVLGVAAETHLLITADKATLSRESLFGETRTVVPLPCIASTHCGYSKPIGYAIVAVAAFLLGAFLGLVGFVFMLFVALFCLVLFSLGKRMFFSVETRGGSLMGVQFKRSIIEGVSIDISKAMQAIELLNKLLVQ